jgi:uncharacterized protein with FMN-binding domain
MRRAPLVLAGTAAGLAGVLLFHPHSQGLSLGAVPSASGDTTTSGASGATGAKSTSHGSTSSSSTGSSTGSSAGSSTGSSGSTATKTYTGTDVTYSYGTLSVRITVSGHSVTKVAIASLTDGSNFRSQSIDEEAIPILEQQALAAQSSNIQGVSGASYTSAGFERSLQSALSRAGI